MFDDGGVTMVWIKKYQDIEGHQPTVITKMRVGGEMRGILRNSMGGIVHDTGWLPNIVTNNGMVNLYDTVAPFGYHHIGDDNTAPDVTQSTLLGHLAYSSTGTGSGDLDENSGSPNYVLSTTSSRRFNAGVGTGTIREFGASGGTSNSDMTVRVLVSPEFVKASDQVLDTYYKFNMWPDTTDTTGTVAISGVNYDFTSRGMNLHLTGFASTQTYFRPYNNLSTHGAFLGNIGTITGSPASYLDWCDSITTTGGGSGYSDYELFWSLNSANHASGIRSISTRHYQGGLSANMGWQAEYDKTVGGGTIMKDNTKTLTLTFRRTWARH